MTDETLLQPGEGTPAPEVTPAPEPAPEPLPAPEGGETPPAETPPEPKPEKKSPVTQLQGRVGYLTKELHAKDAENERLRKLLEVAGSATPPGGEAAPVAPTPAQAPQAPNSPDAFQQAVKAEVARQAFDQKCNEVYAKGKDEFGAEFDGAVGNLNSMGFMGRDMLDAALATGDAAKVIHHLGNDLDEAARISSLPPTAMGAEIAKLAAKVSAPKAQPVSSAPAPIKPLGGSAKPADDVYDSNLSDEEYYALRAKQGAPYARAPRA